MLLAKYSFFFTLKKLSKLSMSVHVCFDWVFLEEGKAPIYFLLMLAKFAITIIKIITNCSH